VLQWPLGKRLFDTAFDDARPRRGDSVPPGVVGSDVPLIWDAAVGLSPAANILSFMKVRRAKLSPVSDPKLTIKLVIPLVDELSGSVPESVAAMRLLVALVDTVALPVTA
jgi:hypothetical protein